MPNDQELVEYLRDHGRGRARFSGAINEGIDLYSCHPEYLLSCFPDVSEYGSNYYYANREGRNRQTDDRSGHWINRRQDPIHKDGQIVGYKRRFTFYLGPGKSNKTDWLMTEYTSDDTPKRLDQIAIVSSSEKIVIEKFIDSKITQEESKDAIVDLIMEFRIKESNHVEESYVIVIQDLDVSYENLVSHEHEELTNFEVASKIKEQEEMPSEDIKCFRPTIPNFILMLDSMAILLVDFLDPPLVSLIGSEGYEKCLEITFSEAPIFMDPQG
ncbi:putative NAC domain-containing protein [Cocos nucifera]|nr:putative NAC domain-containing protein [Cocos nucifera]